jgi:hypothetical protein
MIMKGERSRVRVRMAGGWTEEEEVEEDEAKKKG